MFTPLPMQRVTLYVVKEEAPHAALALAEGELFAPEPSPAEGEALPEHPAAHYQALFLSARMRFQKIRKYLNFNFVSPPEAVEVVSEQELAELNDRLGELWQHCSRLEERSRSLNEALRKVAQLHQTLDIYAHLDVNLGLLQGNLQFLDVRVGVVPLSHLNRLREAAAIAGYLLTPFAISDATALVVLAGIKGSARQIQSLLRAANYRSIPLPPEFQDHPQRVRQQLTARRRRLQQARDALSGELEKLRQAQAQELRRVVHRLTLAAPYALLTDALQGRGGLARIHGWVPKEKLPFLRQTLEKRIRQSFALETRAPTRAEQPRVPSLVRTPPWLQPFTRLVHTYGVPQYGEVDPSWLFAVTFVAMFGMMFGDIGHGAVIAGIGWRYRRRLGNYAPMVLALGGAAGFFGLLYGSLFGYEGVIPPLWVAPLSDPRQLLMAALFWGVGFILLTSVIAIRNRLAAGRYLEALLGGQGLAGSLFYLALLMGVFRWVTQGVLGGREAIALLVPLIFLLGYQWHQVRASFLEKILVVFVENLELLISYIANTLSFLRVAAFGLNHGALAIAVFALAGIMGIAGQWITVILGNFFILLLEGVIVTIQILRLEYYEGFSRFFSGGGYPFQPLTLTSETLELS
jgi:V/A-type H+/Na+-transporting ATPase subunit I